MKKKKILPALIGIFIPITAFTAEYTAVLDMIHADVETTANNTGQASTYAGEVSNNTRVMKNDIHNILSRVETIDNSTTSIAGTTDNIRSYLYDICYGKGNANGWFNSMYVLALDMQSKYNQLVSDLDDLYEHVSTTQNYQLEDIKTTNQTISDNTTSIKDTTKNIETSTDVIEGHTETIASDTTTLKNIFNATKTYQVHTIAPPVPQLYKPSLDLQLPAAAPSIVTRNTFFTDALIDLLQTINWNGAKNVVVNQSANLNLQAIRTNLAEIAKHVTSNTTDKVTVDMLPDITADLLSEYGINAATHDLPNVQENFTGDFHNDLLKLTRFNASVNISASYASISILTNLQSLLARNADQLQAEQKESLETGIEAARNEYDDAEQFWENDSSSENLAVQNKSMLSYKDTQPNFGSLGVSSPVDSIGFTIEAIRLQEDESPINLDVSAQVSHETRNLIESIRVVCTVVLWGVGLVLTYFLLGLMSKLFSWALGLIHPLPVQSGLFMKTENGGIV